MTKESPRPGATWTNREAYLLALACLVTGLLVGSLFRGSAPPMTVPAEATAGASPGSSGPAAPTAESLQPMAAPLLASLKVDPKNFDTLVQLGNLYYDSRIYPQAIDYYTRALETRPKDINVRTDLGTAYWYSGFPDKAVREYSKSLAVDPAHPNTLFNLGVVRSEGLKDYAGAISAWETLLKTHPEYPEKQRVLDLMARARSLKR